jgi:serine/threonine-protein kinase
VRIGPFETLRNIGDGGMGVVYLATDTRNGATVALKTVRNQADSEAREILEAEQLGTQLLKPFSLVSQRVPRVFDYGQLPDCFYVSMEYLDGENLSQLISRGRVPISRVYEIGHELCSFLEEAHGFETVLDDGKPYRSLLHGDLKPRNIRITSDGEVKVCDFGIAKARTLLSRKVPRNDFGSLPYLPPERLEEPPSGMDEYTDLWALGVLLYEMVSGRLPFQARTRTGLETLIVSRQPPPPVADCPPGLWAILGKLLAPTPEERYESAHAVREDLDAFHAGTTTRAEQEGWPRPSAVDEATRRTRALPGLPGPPEGGPHINTVPPEGGPHINAVPPEGGPHISAVPPEGGPHRHGVHDQLAEKTQRTIPPPLPPSRDGTVRLKPDTTYGTSMPRLAAPVRGRRIAAALALVVAILLAGNEIVVARDAATLVGVVSRQTLPDLAGSWNEYERLSARSYLGFGTPGLRRALTRQTQSESDGVINEYRESLLVRERRWMLARDALARAVAANPDNVNLRAAMRYCEGHLRRINGEARNTRQQREAALQDLGAAVTEFRAAAELRPRWPDPFLGLARTFVVGLGDIDRGLDALRRAEQLGYPRGARETAQLAQAYDDRGQSLEASARGVRERPQAIDYLTRAAQAYRQSLALSETVIDYGNAAERALAVSRRLDRVERRLAEQSR